MLIKELRDVEVIDRPPVLDKTISDIKPQQPRMYHVMLNNSDYFPAEAVIAALVDVFRFDTEKAISLMMAAHRSGKAVIATYSKDVAEAKARRVTDIANKAAGYLAKQFNTDVDGSDHVFTAEPAE